MVSPGHLPIESILWIAVAGTVQHLSMPLIHYVPCHPSPAATGCAMAFARWAWQRETSGYH